MNFINRLRAASLAFAGLLAAFAASAAEPLWLRYPAISPDGKQIAFTYRGDIYVVPAKGGQAAPLTIHDAHDFMPVWSHDGKQIAFASDRHGNFDVFVMPSTGGEPVRVTANSAPDYPSDFTPDGKHVLFTSQRRDTRTNIQFPSAALAELYRAPVAGGPAEMVFTTPAQDARYDKAGKRILYHDRKGYENEWRKHHVSPIARDVWMFDSGSGKHTKLTDFGGEDRNPVWSRKEDEAFFLSERSGSFNVWKLSLKEPAKTTQVTQFTNHPVRFLSTSDGGTLCFSWHGELYTVGSGGGKPAKVPVSILTGPKRNEANFVAAAADATEMALSPNGKEIAVVVRGEIFVSSIDHKITKRITNTPEQERSVGFSPDGRKLLYAGERGGSWNLYETSIARTNEPYFYNSTILTEEALLKNGEENFQPKYSPDGSEVAFLENRTVLKVIGVTNKVARLILPGDMNYSYSDGDQHFDWSPDGKWFLSTFLDKSRWSREVGLISATGSNPIVNLTLSGYEDERARWMMGGKALIFASDRYGMRSHGSWGANDDVMGMFLTQEAFDRFKLSKADLELVKEREKKDEPKKDDEKKDDAKKESGTSTNAPAKPKEKKVEPVKIELKNIEDRVVRLTTHSSALADAVLTPDGEKLLYLAKFEGGHDLWLQKPREKETKLLAKLNAEGGQLTLDKDGKNVFVLAGGKITKVDVESGKQEAVSYSGEMVLNLAKEREYIFDHAWRQVLKKFYMTNLHNVDWAFHRREYEKFLPHIDNNWDFAEFLSEILGELNASHTGSGFRPGRTTGDATAVLGLFYDAAFAGPGLKVVEVIEKGPFDRAGAELKAETIIEKIDGVNLTPTTDPDPLLNRKAGKPTLLALFDPASGKRWEETVKPITKGAEDELLYERWVKSRREEVDRLSKGRLGYVHVKGMNDASFRETFSEVLGRNSGKEGIIIDTRFNGGGWLHENLADLFRGIAPYFTYEPRSNKIGDDPMFKWTKKSVVLQSESNYSNAHMFPLLYKTMNLGQLVGTPVAGTGTAVWWETQQDKTIFFGIPQVGVKDRQGRYLENQTLPADHEVYNDPESAAAGRDLQLEKAVEVLLK